VSNGYIKIVLEAWDDDSDVDELLRKGKDLLDIDGESQPLGVTDDENTFTVVYDLLNQRILEPDEESKAQGIPVDNPVEITPDASGVIAVIADGWNSYGYDNMVPPYGEDEGPTENPNTPDQNNQPLDARLDFIIQIIGG